MLDAIRDLGLELQIIFNKGAVMILPAGVNKASGLTAGLDELGLSPHNVAGIGDAENDHAFLRLCGASAAVANALPSLKTECDLVTRGGRGAGVVEVIDRVLEVVVGMGGAIASEHGIGVAKSEWWRRATDPALLRLARAMKQLLDPTGILNPALFWGD